MLQEQQKLFFRVYWACLIEQWYKMLQIIGAITVGYTVGKEIAYMLNMPIKHYHVTWTTLAAAAISYLFGGAYFNYKSETE